MFQVPLTELYPYIPKSLRIKHFESFPEQKTCQMTTGSGVGSMAHIYIYICIHIIYVALYIFLHFELLISWVLGTSLYIYSKRVRTGQRARRKKHSLKNEELLW